MQSIDDFERVDRRGKFIFKGLIDVDHANRSTSLESTRLKGAVDHLSVAYPEIVQK